MQDIFHYEGIGREFQACWTLAASYVQRLGDRGLTWFKGSLRAPFYEHFSFRLGNQLFFVRLEDQDGRLKVPGSREGLFEIAHACQGHPLLMPMRNSGGIWLPAYPGWGLLDARTRLPLDPKDLLSPERVGLTHWELHDLAVRAVMVALGPERVRSHSNHPGISPSVWFEGESGLEWAIVRFARGPLGRAPLPSNWAQVCEGASGRGTGDGFFAVAVFQGKDPLSGRPLEDAPLYRGDDILISLRPLRRFAQGAVQGLRAMPA
jgi:hypothetical protein